LLIEKGENIREKKRKGKKKLKLEVMENNIE
jgi:hypothetical protein